MKNLHDILKNRYEENNDKMVESFSATVKSISELFYMYSINDIATSIFVSNMWLPNIASPVKHQFFTVVFATLKPEDFSKKDKVVSYKDFKALINKLYELAPHFPTIEDYVPESDWGEIKFYHNGKNYRFFYGNELSNVYEYLSLFQLLYNPYDKEYQQYANRSPAKEIEFCLSFQQEIIEGISTQPTSDSLEISPGHIEIPTKGFWENAKNFYTGFKPELLTTQNILEHYSIELGEYPKETLNIELFGEKVFNGSLLEAFFIKHEKKYLPILPRRYNSILFDKWSKVFHEYNNKITISDDLSDIRLGMELFMYISCRINKDYLFPLASATTDDGKPHEVIFPAVFISKNKLIMLYLTNPSVSSKDTEKELDDIASKLNDAINLASSQPTTLALHMDRQNVQFCSEVNENVLKPEIIVLIPQVSTNIKSFSIPRALLGRVMFLDSFLGIIDESESSDMLADFLDYLDEIEDRTGAIISPLDKFGSFKDSYGILIGGASEPTHIALDPHWGTAMRYNSLSEFWKSYPDVNFQGHPRSWKVSQETPTRVRLTARGYLGLALYCKISQTNIFFSAPFHDIEYEQGNISNLMMECLEDSLSRRESIIKEHVFFQYFDRLNVHFFPLSIVRDNEKYKHLHHLCQIDKYWSSDIGKPSQGEYGIRIVFDEKAVTQAFMDIKDCSLEAEIVIEIIKQIDKVIRSNKLDNIIEQIGKTRHGKPRFKMFSVKKEASFPDFISSFEPKPFHFKKAKKRIAELAKMNGITTGAYELEEAKKLINNLRDLIVAEINSAVLKYEHKATIPFLLARIDALNADYARHQHTAEHGLTHDIDYEPHKNYSEKHTNYLQMHKNYRYLIEKFVHLEPKGKDLFRKEDFQYLIAVIDWLHVLYNASDNIHYEIMATGMKIDSEYLIDVIYDEDMKTKEDTFANEEAQLDLGLVGNPDDRVSSPRPIENYLDKLDSAARKDLGFSFRIMVAVLKVLALWPTYNKTNDEKTSYKATFNEIREICLEYLLKTDSLEIERVVTFLTLDKLDVISIRGQNEPCLDLPVWEYKKRRGRYSIKPLVKIEEYFYWGPYSTHRTAGVWTGLLSGAMLPLELDAPNIEKVQRNEKKLIEDALVDRALEIMKRFTSFALKNLKLHNQKPKGTHPSDLGDYDILSFYPDKNIVFNIECKDILPPFCFKDAKRLREKIFGIPGKDQGFFKHINKRKDYLKDHIFDIAKTLNWSLDKESPPKILTVYLSRRSFWWTRFPPDEIEASFIRIDMMDDFIRNT